MNKCLQWFFFIDLSWLVQNIFKLLKFIQIKYKLIERGLYQQFIGLYEHSLVQTEARYQINLSLSLNKSFTISYVKNSSFIITIPSISNYGPSFSLYKSFTIVFVKNSFVLVNIPLVSNLRSLFLFWKQIFDGRQNLASQTKTKGGLLR